VPLVWGVHSPPDLRRWTEDGIVSDVRSAGFDVVEVRRRGGIFASLGALLAQVPLQLFLPGRTRRTWPRSALFAVSYILVMPFAWALRVLDFLDRRQNFTLGYTLLCRRAGDQV
jgi:hypothetical protein